MNFAVGFINDVPAALANRLILAVTAAAVTGCLFAGMTQLIFQIFRCVGISRIAKRRGIRNSWLAWIPFGQSWILGSISDHYRYFTKGEETSRRKQMLAMSLAHGVLYLAGVVLTVSTAIGMARAFFGGVAPEAFFAAVSSNVLNLVVLCLGTVVAVVFLVLRLMVSYDLFASCAPKTAVLFLILGILVPVSMPFLIFASKEQDGGMPPRKEAPQPEEPLQEEPWYEAPAAEAENMN